MAEEEKGKSKEPAEPEGEGTAGDAGATEEAASEEKASDAATEKASSPPEEKRPSSPWPSAHKANKPSSPPPKPAAFGKAAWGAPLDKLDRAWTKLESRLAAGVLVAEIVTLVFWIAIRSLSSTGKGGGGFVFRCLLSAAVLGYAAHRASKKHPRHEIITTIAVVFGLVVGTRWGDAGTAYFSNLFGWMQNASILVFFGGVNEIAKRLTLWLALLGASLATAQGKHINVDVAMRFLAPRARVPVAVLGWLTAAVVSIAASWGFFDYVAVEEMRSPPTMACPGDETKRCPTPAGEKIDKVVTSTRRNLFLAGRQVSLDVRTFPRVIAGTPYNHWLTPHDWNEWLRGGGWEDRFKAEDVKAFELPEDGSIDYRNPSVTAIPGATEAVPKLLVPILNLVFSFGLLVIGLRFILRSLLAIAGWIKVDPDAAHGDEELVHAHESSAESDKVAAAIKEEAS